MSKRQIQEICLWIQEMWIEWDSRSKNIYKVSEYLNKVWWWWKFTNNTNNIICMIASLKYSKVTTDKYDDKYF